MAELAGTTLRYGSADAGAHVYACDRVLNAVMARLGRCLNLAPHRVSGSVRTVVVAAADGDGAEQLSDDEDGNQQQQQSASAPFAAASAASVRASSSARLHVCADLEGHLALDGRFCA